MNQQNLTIYDEIVDIIPGTVAILLAISVLPADYIGDFGVNNLTLGSGLLIIVGGYLMGHLVQAVASPIDEWVYFQHHENYPFEAVLQEAREEDGSSVEKRFDENIEEFFEGSGDDAAELNGFEIFRLTQSYLWNHDIGRARRFQILYTFLRSIWVIFALGAGVHLVAAVAEHCGGYELVWSLRQSGLIVVGLSVGAVISYRRRLKYHAEMANSLVFDFYANVLSSNEEI